MKLILFTFSLLLSASASASNRPKVAHSERPLTVKECGTYPAEGYYDEIVSPDHNDQKKRVFLMNRNSNSEIRVFLLNKNLDKLIPKDHLGTKFKVTLKFVSQCLYRCEAELVDAIEPIDPFDQAKTFNHALPKDRIGPAIACLPNGVPLQPAAQ